MLNVQKNALCGQTSFVILGGGLCVNVAVQEILYLAAMLLQKIVKKREGRFFNLSQAAVGKSLIRASFADEELPPLHFLFQNATW